MAKAWDASYDLVIVGSGGGATCAGLVAVNAGLRPLIVEKTDKVGGSTALSGGVIWIPCNPVMKRAGTEDSYELAKTYLDACAGDTAPPYSDARRAAYITRGPEAISFLEKLGIPFVYADGYSCYHEGELPGGLQRGRSFCAEIFDTHQLGEWAPYLNGPVVGGASPNSIRGKFDVAAETAKSGRALNLPVHTHEGAVITLAGRTWKSKVATWKVAFRAAQNFFGRGLAGMGRAFQGRMLQLLLKHKVEIWRESPATELVTENGRVTGVVVNRQGKSMRIQALRGVLVDTGGYARNLAMREKYGPKPASASWTNATQGDTGECLEMLIGLGAGTANIDQAIWTPNSLMPGGRVASHSADLPKPFSIMVDAKGERFVNEATSYVKIGNAIYQRHKEMGGAVPCWVIMESRHRERYRWGGYPPGTVPEPWLSSGYIKTADTLEELARQCGIDPAGLKKTVGRFNGFARKGVDDDFMRGKSTFNHFWGDPTCKPNPNLGPIEKAPFYAIQIFPGDVGTFGGVLIDEQARVLREDGSVIEGVYACGTVTAAMSGRSYPGAGASVGPSVVFGYIAARHMAEQKAAVPAAEALSRAA